MNMNNEPLKDKNEQVMRSRQKTLDFTKNYGQRPPFDLSTVGGNAEEAKHMLRHHVKGVALVWEYCTLRKVLELTDPWLAANGYIDIPPYCEESIKVAFDESSQELTYSGAIDPIDWRLCSYSEIDAFRFAVAEYLLWGEREEGEEKDITKQCTLKENWVCDDCGACSDTHEM